jgi:molybdopterin converting factor small subunit
MGEDRIEVDGRTVRECIEAAEARYPGFQELILDGEGGLNRFVRLCVNGEMLASDALDTPVSGDDSLAVLAVVAGG